MKAIIVDDEKHVRDAIRLLVPWNELGIDDIREAPDGQTAISLIKEHKPQIIFTDMIMPVMGGAQLLEWLHTHYPSGKTIVISGFDDFQLVRHTVQYGGLDYILKPVDAEQLRSAVIKAIASWRQDEDERRRGQQLNIEMNQIRPAYWDKMLSNLITDPSTFESVADSFANEYGLDRNVREGRLAIVSLDTLSGSLKQKFESNIDLLFFSITNICNEFLQAGKQGIAYRYWNSDDAILILLYGQGSAERILNDIQQGIWSVFHSRVDIGVSNVQPFPSGLPTAYTEAGIALRRRNLWLTDKKIHPYTGQPSNPSAPLSFSDYAELIQLSVRSGSKEQIEKSVQQWIEAVKRLDSIEIGQLELWWQEYTVLRNRWQHEWFGDRLSDMKNVPGASRFQLPLDEKGAFSIALWRELLIGELTRLSEHMLAHQQQDNNVIFEIAKYIQNHYHQDITLQEIANHFYLSREYISRKFKQEFHVNLSDYLSNIRLEKAKLLLLNPHLKIAQVAAMVGYEDEKYFSKVFKKMCGCSPNEYRKVNQK
ncbi:response regulator [Paenibacillus piri]|uniref:Response regulator n=1 Tax=Paenibacillus piri TaxID=2547395 RepID=A0A4R5KZ08_9BACL|nr:helix-turn-helix domain-containing protein [Paenibacillus piri]TDG00509.1 response regulator [Paenibacillus piri]